MPSPLLTDLLVRDPGSSAIPVWLVAEGGLEEWLRTQPAGTVKWLTSAGFRAEKHRVALVPGAAGEVAAAVLGLGKLASLDDLSLWHTAGLSDKLPPGDYQLATVLPRHAATQALLGFGYGFYRFDRYRRCATTPRTARLVAPESVDVSAVEHTLTALALARDLINTPANDLGPAELAEAVQQVARRHAAECSVIEGEELLA